MASTANKDTFMGEYTQFVCDEESVAVSQKKTVVAHAPVEGSGHAALREYTLTAYVPKPGMVNQKKTVEGGEHVVVVGERTQLFFDKETGMEGQKKTVVAQVPVEGLGHAIVIAEQVQVRQVVKLIYRLAS